MIRHIYYERYYIRTHVYLSAGSFITLLKLVWREYDIVAMNEWKKKWVGLQRTWVSKRTVYTKARVRMHSMHTKGRGITYTGSSDLTILCVVSLNSQAIQRCLSLWMRAVASSKSWGYWCSDDKWPQSMGEGWSSIQGHLMTSRETCSSWVAEEEEESGYL